VVLIEGEGKAGPRPKEGGSVDRDASRNKVLAGVWLQSDLQPLAEMDLQEGSLER